MRKKRENGMAKESGMGDFPRKQFESVLLLCRRYCAHMGWVLSLTPRDAGSGTRAEVRIPLAGTMFPIEGSVELHTIHPALTTADGLRWQILRELALLSDKME